jgi:hypothetical protein
MGEEKAPGRIQLVSVGMSTVETAPGGDVTHSVPFILPEYMPFHDFADRLGHSHFYSCT